MKRKHTALRGALLVAAFITWTVMIQTVDVRPWGQNGTDIGFAVLNRWFHGLTGVHLALYTITDWLGLVPLFVSLGFAALGTVQLLERKSLWKVDRDILALGVYYAVVIAAYLLFEAFPVNYRPIPIDGRMEASYPSSTTLLVLCVMPTLQEQTARRAKSPRLKKAVRAASILFSVFMVAGRLISGVHWLTDIIGAVLLSAGLFALYRAAATEKGSEPWNFTKNCKPCGKAEA